MGYIANVVPSTPILSTWGNQIRDRTVQYFASAAERTAQWPSPPVGALSYLIDVDTISLHNGTGWVQITQTSATVATSESRGNTAYGALTTPGPALTLDTATKALVKITAQGDSAGAGVIALVAVAVSGATTIAAADVNALILPLSAGAGWPARVTAEVYFSGLTAGSNTFTLQYKTSSASPAVNFSNRTISAVGIA